MSLQDELIRHGEAIGRLLDDEAVQRTFEALNAYYFEHWTAAEEPKDRETIWHEMRALGRLQEHMKIAVSTGQAEADSKFRAANPIRRD